MIRADEGSDQMPLSPLNPMNVSEMRCVWWFSHHCEGGHPTCGRPVRHEHMADRRRRPWARRSRPTSTDDVARWQATLSVSPILSKRQPQAVAGQGRPAWHGFAMKWSELGHEVRGDWHDPISCCRSDPIVDGRAGKRSSKARRHRPVAPFVGRIDLGSALYNHGMLLAARCRQQSRSGPGSAQRRPWRFPDPVDGP